MYSFLVKEMASMKKKFTAYDEVCVRSVGHC